ncbi:energy transducer TonB [Dyella terrae]|nr:energy transducer TonB [Dyella terrae]
MIRSLLGFLVCSIATTQVHAAMRTDFESSALVSGTIVIATDGSVRRVSVDDPEAARPTLVKFVQDSAMKWHFDPVVPESGTDEKRYRMTVRLIAKKAANGNYDVVIRGVSFGDGTTTGEVRDNPENQQMPPRYPMSAIERNVTGTVYLVLHIDREGKVTDADAEQVNLNVFGPENTMEVWRKQFASGAVKAARQWTYRVPTTGPLASEDGWVIRTSIVYSIKELSEMNKKDFWQTYIPGPRIDVPWLHKYETQSGNGDTVDALPDYTVQTRGAGPRLRTPAPQGS